MKFAVLAHQLKLGKGDVALNRLDVSPDLGGAEEGMWSVTQLEAQGVRILNRPPALLGRRFGRSRRPPRSGSFWLSRSYSSRATGCEASVNSRNSPVSR